ncbi:MAG TPA: NAD(P)-dependent oxidoreductase [Herpetosiphonaceae bacterium]
MKIALFGASGMIGSRILEEALSRNHQVTAVVRDPSRITSHPARAVVTGDILNPAQVAEIVAGHDVAINATSQGLEPGQTAVDAAHSLLDGLKQAGVQRVLVVGGAGSLEVAPGVQLVDAPGFPPDWRGVASAHRDALGVYREADLDWTYISPSAMIQPGERRGQFRTGGDQLLTDENGNSHISTDDFAIAILDEVERPQSIRRRMTVGY